MSEDIKESLRLAAVAMLIVTIVFLLVTLAEITL